MAASAERDLFWGQSLKNARLLGVPQGPTSVHIANSTVPPPIFHLPPETLHMCDAIIEESKHGKNNDKDEN